MTSKKTRYTALLLLCMMTVAGGESALAQGSNAEIFVFSIDSKGAIQTSSGSNISNTPGYDNQPSFSIDGSSVLFTSDRAGSNTDIYEYIFNKGKTVRITESAVNEYTARERKKGTISFVREGDEQLMSVWQIDRKSKKESWALSNKEPVAYYDWDEKGRALVWIRYASSAHFVDPKEKTNTFVADRVQPSTPHRIPGSSKFSFVHRQGNDELWIKEFDPLTRGVRPIAQTKDEKIDYAWTPDGVIIMGSGSKLYAFDEKNDQGWTLYADLTGFGLKEITRLDVSPDGKRIALVSNQ